MPRNPKKSWREQGYSFISNIYAGIALMVTCAIASYDPLYALRSSMDRSHNQRPSNGAVVLSLFLSVRAVLSLPTATGKQPQRTLAVKSDVVAQIRPHGS